MRRKFQIMVLISMVTMLACFTPLRQKVYTVLNGKEYSFTNTEYERDTTITIKGIYKNYLFKDDKFEGQISIEGYDFLDRYEKVTFTVSRGYGQLICYSNSTGYMEFDMFGTIMFSRGFQELLILVDSPAEELVEDDMSFIVAPGVDRETDVLTAQELSKSVRWLSGVNWTQ